MRLGFVVKQHKTLCCFHEDHNPSLAFKRNKFKCWSCGACGDTISLVERVLHKDFLDACRWLADEHNVILSDKNYTAEPTPMCNFEASRYERFFERPWLSDEARRFLFDERRLDERVVRWCRLTSWRDRQGTPWLQIPYYDREGRLTGVQNRNLTSSKPPRGEAFHSPSGETEGGPRFRFPQGSECGIYNLPVLNLLRPGEALYITEGCSDCWAMLSAGHKAIAIPSATLLKRKDKELLSSLNSSPKQGRPGGVTFHMFPDRDEPGERLFLQLKEVLPTLVHHQLPPDCKDFGQYYMKSLSPPA